MGKPTGFIEYGRQDVPHRPVDDRVKDYFEIDLPLPEEALIRQAARCMDCGVPFCHGVGCPLGNRVPEFNDLVYRGQWRRAAEVLHSTNNFPEITGRICPAPCETACTLSINDDPVLIRHIELQVAQRAIDEGWVAPQPPRFKSGKRVAVVGSGPAGLACAQQLARAGHDVVVFEKDSRVGGLLRYGIPDFKLDKKVIDWRIAQMQTEGVQFQTGVAVGQDISHKYLRKMFDAVCLAMGAGEPRDLPVPGRGLENVHFAMDFLAQQNHINAGDPVSPDDEISAAGRVVAVIGGGDTGSDCVGTARRQGAKGIWQLEILPEPPARRPTDTPWPTWPRILRTSSSHEEGCHRRWSVLTRKLSGAGVNVTQLHGVEVDWMQGMRGMEFRERPGTDFVLKVDMVLVAMGFVHVVHGPIVKDMGLSMDARGNIVTSDYMTSVEGVFAAGDAVSGASLVVRAIGEGRAAATAIDRWLKRSEARRPVELPAPR